MGAADGVVVRYQALLASRVQRFCTKWTLRFPGKLDNASETHSSATFESIEKANSPINGKEKSYWLKCNYKLDDKLGVLNQRAAAMEIETKMVPFYQKLKFKRLKNIMHIYHVFNSNDNPMIICGNIDFRLDNYLDKFREDLLSNGNPETDGFRNVIRDLVDGLECLHFRGVAHGNLRLSTTYCSSRYYNEEYEVNLAEFGYDSNAQDLEETQKSDWSDLGKLLHDALKILYKEETVRNRQYELLDLCKTLQHLDLKDESPRDVIMRHPAMFPVPYFRVYYINSAVAFIERSQLERNIVDDDVLSKMPWTENIGSKEDSEKLVKYIEQATEHDAYDSILHPKSHTSYDPSSGWGFVKFVSYFLQYHGRSDVGVDKDIQGIIGGHARSQEAYFRRYQPKMLIALKIVAEQAGFRLSDA